MRTHELDLVTRTEAHELDLARLREAFPVPDKPWEAKNLAERGITPNPTTTWLDVEESL